MFGTGGCSKVVIKDSISAGCVFAGFVQPGHKCGGTNENFMNNVAHSSKRMGAYFYPGPDQAACTEASLFSAYHCIENGAIYNAAVADIRMSKMTMIDNFMGLMC